MFRKINQPFFEEDDGLNIAGSNDQDLADLEGGSNELETASPVKEKTAQTPEENAKYQAARHKAEEKANALEERLLKNAKALGFDSVEEFEKEVQKTERERIESEKAERVEQFGYDPDELIAKKVDERLKNDPRIIEFEQSQRQATAQTAINDLNREFGLDIKSVSELDSIDNADDVVRLVGAGYDIVKAYRMANYDKLEQVKAVQDAKQISNSGRSDFIGTVGTPNPESVSVPNEVAESLRRQGWSDEKILTHYKMVKNNTR